MKLLPLAVSLALVYSSAALVAAAPYAQLAAELAKGAPARRLEVSVQPFFYGQDTNRLSDFSYEAQRELIHAIESTGRFILVRTDKLAALEEEARVRKLLEFATRGEPLGTAHTVEAVVLGSYHTNATGIVLLAELIQLHGARLLATARTELPLAQAKTTNPLVPVDLEGGRKNEAEAQRFLTTKRDFGLSLNIKGGRRVFRGGDTITYEITAARAAHIALVVHQTDGTTEILFPNKENQNTWVTAGTKVLVPGPNRENFEIVVGPPFGQDLVQAVACTQANELHKFLAEHAGRTRGGDEAIRLRGQYARKLEEGITGSATNVLWSFETLSVDTYPAPGRNPQNNSGAARSP